MINIILASLFDTDKIVLYRQLISPVVCGDTVSPAHYEVLCKFKDKHGLVMLPPGEFIEALESYDLQLELDRLIVNKAICWMLEYDNNSSSVYHINISPKSVHILPEILNNYTPNTYHRLSFELTENSLIDLNLASLTRIKYLRDLGVGISFDDFGSKYVSYSEIKLIQPNYIKIDGSYVRNAATDTFDNTVVKNIIALAKAINGYTIAESVENQQIADHMITLGADYLQGWHIGKLEKMQ